MHRLFKKEQLLTIPNLLSVIRLLLIPLIVWLYIGVQRYWAAVAVIAVSGITDIADGFIARKFNMVSDFGKILDPVADKFTQGIVLICLASRYKWMIALIVLFIIKEVCQGVMGYITIRKNNSVNSAKWYGKANTVFLFIVMVVLILFPHIPIQIANTLILCSACFTVITLVLYVRFYIRFWRQDHTEETK